MNQPQRFQNQRGAQQHQGNGRNNERRGDSATENGQPTLEQYAGGVARNLIKQTGVEDTTEIWRALKRAYLTGYADATR